MLCNGDMVGQKSKAEFSTIQYETYQYFSVLEFPSLDSQQRTQD